MERKNYFFRISPEYVGKDCVQTMIGYRSSLLYYGDGKLLYHGKLTRSQPYVNAYLTDARAEMFPYYTIPEHMEREWGNNIRLTNQILEYEKPYINISNDSVFQETVYPYQNSALIHVKPLIMKEPLHCYDNFISSHLDELQRTVEKDDPRQKVFTSREELIHFLTTGVAQGESPYTFVHVTDLDEIVKEFEIPNKQELLTKERTELMNGLNSDAGKTAFPSRAMKSELLSAILNMTELEPQELIKNCLMIKGLPNGKLELQTLQVFYQEPNQYFVWQESLPIVTESLEDLMKCDYSIKRLKKPKIVSKYNPDISEDQVELEQGKAKTLHKQKNKSDHTLFIRQNR